MKTFNNHPRGGLRAATLVLAAALLGGCASFPENRSTPANIEDHGWETSMARGDAAYRNGNTDQAMLEYVKALQIEPANASLLYRIGRVHAETGNDQTALSALQQAMRADPEHAGVREELGLLFLRNKQNALARLHLTAAVEKQNRRWRAHNGLGILADLEGKHSAAQGLFLQALQSAGDRVMVYNNLGYSYYLDGDLGEAIRHFNMALEIDPYNEKAWSNVALVAVRRQRHEDALEAFLQITDPARAHNNVGYLCLVQGQYDTARRYLSEAIRLSPSYYTVAHENLAKVEYRLAKANRQVGTGN